MVNSSRRSRVLMVAFHFPPEGGSGAQRSLKFARYLPEFGWDVDVLTATTGAYELQDASLLKEVPAQVSVHRSLCVDLTRKLSIRGKYPGWLAFPDRYGSWLPFGVWRGLELARKRRPDAIYSTSPIGTAHLIALALAKWSGLPWIADFRDPWQAGAGGPLLRIHRALEARVMARASHIIANTPQLEDSLMERFPSLASRLTVLPNGYDEADFADVPPAATKYPGRVTVLHMGETYAGLRNPMPLLEALARLPGRGASGLVFRFVGNSPSLATPEFQAWRAARGLEGSVTIEPQVRHRECVAELMGADVLLLLQCSPATNRQVPAKFYEYLRSGRPILVVTPPGSATARVAVAEGVEWVVDPEDPAALDRVVAELAAMSASGSRAPSRRRGARFERRSLTGELGGILSRAVERS